MFSPWCDFSRGALSKHPFTPDMTVTMDQRQDPTSSSSVVLVAYMCVGDLGSCIPEEPRTGDNCPLKLDPWNFLHNLRAAPRKSPFSSAPPPLFVVYMITGRRLWVLLLSHEFIERSY